MYCTHDDYHNECNEQLGTEDWTLIAQHFPGRTDAVLLRRYEQLSSSALAAISFCLF